MPMDNGVLPESFYRIIEKAVAKKSYGSIEIYLESGRITQITERIINKIPSGEKKLIGQQISKPG